MGIYYKGERLYFEVSGQSKGAGKSLSLFVEDMGEHKIIFDLERTKRCGLV